jgi:predicted Zn-dependent protease
MTANFARPHRWEDEAVADRDGVARACALGYDPMEMANLFGRLDDGPIRGATLMPSFLPAHPYRAQRYAAVKAQVDELQSTGLGRRPYVGKKNLRERITCVEKQFME